MRTAVGAAAAGATFDLAAHWLIAAAQKITGDVVATITGSTSPQLTAAWFQRSFAPMAALGAALALLVTLIALTSAAARRDPSALAGTLAGIVRAGIGTGLLIALTTLALQVSDGISADVVASSHQAFWSQVGSAWGSSGFGGFGSSALAMLMAIVQLIAGVLVWLELAVRNAAIYLTVLFFPVALAASIWPTLAGWTSRLVRLLFLFVILKPVVLVVLAFAGNAALAGLALHGGLASSAGTIIAAITIFALAAMAPWALMLIVAADAESAAVGAGVRAAAGHAVSDGAATAGRLGGRVRGGASRAAGAFGSAGGDDQRRGGRQAGWGAGGVGRPERRGRRAEPVGPVGRWAELPGRGTSAIFGRCRSRPRAGNVTAAQRGGCRGSGDRGGRGRSRPDRNSTRTGVPRRRRGPDAPAAGGRAVGRALARANCCARTRTAARRAPVHRRGRRCRRLRARSLDRVRVRAPAPGRRLGRGRGVLVRVRGREMSGEGSEASYRFAPHPGGGFILGLRVAQLAGLIIALALALASLRLGGLGALALAIGVAGLVGRRGDGADQGADARAVDAGRAPVRGGARAVSLPRSVRAGGACGAVGERRA